MCSSPKAPPPVPMPPPLAPAPAAPKVKTQTPAALEQEDSTAVRPKKGLGALRIERTSGLNSQ